MKDLIYLDANFIIPTIVLEHTNRDSALKKLLSIGDEKFCISYLTLDEVIYTLSKYIHDRKSVYSLTKKTLLSNDSIEVIGIESNHLHAEKYLRFWEKSGLAARDAFHVFMMKQNNIKRIATLDKDFIKNQKKLGIKVV